jgi:hypothetical protein
MKAKIFSKEANIGTSELQLGDESMGALFGDFLPNANYYSSVQKQVHKFWSTSKPNHQTLLSLNINVHLENGYFLFPYGGVTFGDTVASNGEPIQIDIAGVDRHVIEDFFLQEPPKGFVEEPWESISIEQKLAFEYELKREIGINKGTLRSILRFDKSDHILANLEFSALCIDSRNDHLLFATNNVGSLDNFAVVHLTRASHREKSGWPKVEFYKDFDEFKYLRMFPDKTD